MRNVSQVVGSAGTGRTPAGWYVMVVALLALIGAGGYAYSRQLIHGEIVTGMRDIGAPGGAAWGLYIVFVIYFIGVSFAGISTAALVRILNLKQLKPVTRMAEFLTVVALLLGAASVMADLGQPARALLYLPLYGRPMSPFFYTFSLVIAGYLFSTLVYMFVDGRRDAFLSAGQGGWVSRIRRAWAVGYQDTPEERRRHERACWWLALFIIPLLVIAHSTLGVIFGLQAGRPGWFSALQAPSFVLMAAASGIGLLIIVAALLRATMGLRDRVPVEVFRWLSNFLWVLVLAYLYFTAIEVLTATYAAPHPEMVVYRHLLRGEYAWFFWVTMAMLIIPFLFLFAQWLLGRYHLGLIVVAAAMVNVASVGKRYLIVVPSQTHGHLLPYGTGTYSPTWVEYSVILGLLALGTLMYAVFVKVVPVVGFPDERG